MATPDPAPVRRGRKNSAWWERPTVMDRTNTPGPDPDPSARRRTHRLPMRPLAEDDVLVPIRHNGKTFKTPLSSLRPAEGRNMYEDEVEVDYEGIKRFVPLDDLRPTKPKKRPRRPKADPAIASVLQAILGGQGQQLPMQPPGPMAAPPLPDPYRPSGF